MCDSWPFWFGSGCERKGNENQPERSILKFGRTICLNTPLQIKSKRFDFLKVVRNLLQTIHNGVWKIAFAHYTHENYIIKLAISKLNLCVSDHQRSRVPKWSDF